MSSQTADVQIGSLWSCRTAYGWCVVRVDGVQTGVEGDSVVAVPARRGSHPMTFAGSPSREIQCEGFLIRYAPMTREEAERQCAASSPEADDPETTRPTENRPHPRQLSLLDVASPPPNGTWRWDSIVINAGVGSASFALARDGLVPVGVESEADDVASHRANGLDCIEADPASWAPWGRARLVLCLRPSSPTPPRREEEETEDGSPCPIDPRLECSVSVAVACGAQAIVVELEGGRRGSEKDRRRMAYLAERAGFRAYTSYIDPAFLGLPQRRPTCMMVAIRVPDEARRAPLKWPQPTHCPGISEGGMKPFETIRSALSLDGEWEGPCGEVASGDLLSVDLPAPTIGPKGLASRLRKASPAFSGEDEEARSLTSAELARLQGLPDGFSLGSLRQDESPGSKKSSRALEARRRRAASISFPPVLASAVASCALSAAGLAAEWLEKGEGK